MFVFHNGIVSEFWVSDNLGTVHKSDQQIVHRIIYDELCLNQIKPSAAEQYIQIIETLKAQGAQAVILGCTEIGLLINEENSPLPVFDTTLLHIDSAVAWMVAQ